MSERYKFKGKVMKDKKELVEVIDTEYNKVIQIFIDDVGLSQYQAKVFDSFPA